MPLPFPLSRNARLVFISFFLLGFTLCLRYRVRRGKRHSSSVFYRSACEPSMAVSVSSSWIAADDACDYGRRLRFLAPVYSTQTLSITRAARLRARYAPPRVYFASAASRCALQPPRRSTTFTPPAAHWWTPWPRPALPPACDDGVSGGLRYRPSRPSLAQSYRPARHPRLPCATSRMRRRWTFLVPGVFIDSSHALSPSALAARAWAHARDLHRSPLHMEPTFSTAHNPPLPGRTPGPTPRLFAFRTTVDATAPQHARRSLPVRGGRCVAPSPCAGNDAAVAHQQPLSHHLDPFAATIFIIVILPGLNASASQTRGVWCSPPPACLALAAAALGAAF
ncbi:hypothetical protein B0H13DRAFT_2512049 [Mycena leptocephala]|nr:hypothetical protein B0H13DRAFT_2512049 [Mycena leptocephala]